LAMKHLVGLRTGALRPDRLWGDSLAAGGKPFAHGRRAGSRAAAASTTVPNGPLLLDSVLTFLKAHAHRQSSIKQHAWLDEAALGRQRSELIDRLRARVRALRERAGGRPRSITA